MLGSIIWPCMNHVKHPQKIKFTRIVYHQLVSQFIQQYIFYNCKTNNSLCVNVSSYWFRANLGIFWSRQTCNMKRIFFTCYFLFYPTQNDVFSEEIVLFRIAENLKYVGKLFDALLNTSRTQNFDPVPQCFAIPWFLDPLLPNQYQSWVQCISHGIYLKQYRNGIFVMKSWGGKIHSPDTNFSMSTFPLFCRLIILLDRNNASLRVYNVWKQGNEFLCNTKNVTHGEFTKIFNHVQIDIFAHLTRSKARTNNAMYESSWIFENGSWKDGEKNYSWCWSLSIFSLYHFLTIWLFFYMNS